MPVDCFRHAADVVVHFNSKMSEKNTPDFHLLNLWARSGIAYLHPGGKKGTAKLFELLEFKPGMNVLEFGCGTGATLADLYLIPGLNITGVDISNQMLRTAKQRLRFCGMQHHVTLKKISPNEKLPFADNCFDIVYTESVLAIIDEREFPNLLNDILRILKPGGRIASIDAIWREECTAKQIAFVNKRCLDHFGLIQSLAKPATRIQWEECFKTSGLHMMSSMNISNNILSLSQHQINHRSSLFTKLKKLSLLVSPWLWYHNIKVFFSIKMWHTQDQNYLTNYIFIAKKPLLQ